MTKPTQNNFSFDSAINSADTASSLVNQFIVSPILNMGIAGFVFDIRDEEKIELESDITDHYTENNTAIQVNIANKPDIITLRGYVGELVHTVSAERGDLQKITEKIVTINAFVPTISATAKQTRSLLESNNQNNSDFFAQGVDTGVDLYQTFRTLNPPKTKQAQAFNFFKALWASRQLVSLETPYTFYSDMAIQSVTAIQGADSTTISDFTITLKKIRFAKTITAAVDPNKLYQGRALAQASAPEKKGTTNGKNVSATGKEKLKSLFTQYSPF